MAFEPDLKNELFPGMLFRCIKSFGLFTEGKFYRFKRYKTEWDRPEWWFELYRSIER